MEPAQAGFPLSIFATRIEAELALVDELEQLLRAQPACVLGLPTGDTPIGVYRELARRHRENGLSLARATSFNLDEYLGLAPDHPAGFGCWMRAQFFAHVDLPAARVHVPRCDVRLEDAPREAERYERAISAAGGIDFQLLGIGRNGHIGFNEPGSGRDTRTRVVELDASTQSGAAAAFGGLEHVPSRAITLGVATILTARSIRVLAFGRAKAEIVKRALFEAPSAALPASWLRGHSNVRLYVDRELADAAGL